MAWNGYVTYAGQELFNSARTEAYLRDVGWFHALYENTDLGVLLGEEYQSALLDNAPWVDDDIPASLDFYGLYPLDINGLENSTATSNVVESINDGGTPGRVRRTTRTVVFNALILAATDAGAAYGMRWLRTLLNGSACGNLATATCNGDELCYLDSEPQVEDGYNYILLSEIDGGDAEGAGDGEVDGGDAEGGGSPLPTEQVNTSLEDCLNLFRRSLRKVVFNSGPNITAKREATDGSNIWAVTFSAVAGNPYEFGSEFDVVVGFMDPTIDDPYVNGLDGIIDLNGYIYTGTDCAVPIYQPVYDPLCPSIVLPPAVPSVPLGCYTAPVNWRRRQFTLPDTVVPTWGEIVPVLKVYARDADVRNLRLRFYADVNGDGSIVDDPCSYCGDIVISYVPQDSILVFDGSDQIVYVENPGGIRRRADSLVFATDGTPFDWPALTCGFGYVVTIDLPQTQVPPVLDFAVTPRVA